MAITIPFFRLIINERLRHLLGINLKNKKIYVFKVNHKTYLSVDTIPKTGEAKRLDVKLGNRYWYINIPYTYLEYIPTSYKLLNTRGKVLELIKGE